MEDIKVGEYVRDIDGVINKVTEIQDYKEENDIWYQGEKIVGGTWKSMVKNHSFRLADLAEPGDIGVMDCYGFQVKKFLTKEDIFELRTENYELLEILTKEQFDRQKYIVGE